MRPKVMVSKMRWQGAKRLILFTSVLVFACAIFLCVSPEEINPTLTQVESSSNASSGDASSDSEKSTLLLKKKNDPQNLDSSNNTPITFEVIERELFSSTNLRDILLKRLPEARRGDGDSNLWVWAILYHCVGAQQHGAPSNEKAWRLKVDGPNTPQNKRDFYSAEIRRCEGVQQLALTEDLGDGSSWLVSAANTGQSSAEATAIVHCRDLSLAQDQCIRYLHNLLSGAEPEVIDLLSLLPLLAGEPLDGAPTDAAIASLGTLLAKCALGADCSATSVAMKSFCISGCPAYQNVSDAILQTVDRQRYEAASRYARRLVEIVRSGSVNWPEVRQAEKLIRDGHRTGTNAPPLERVMHFWK
jgi:hypothetical protein